jgi:tetratricopeptide (TPR) repeat protein
MDGKKNRLLFCTLALGLALHALLPLNLAARVGRDAKQPRDQEEAVKWMQDSLKHAGMLNIRINSEYVLFDDARSHSYGIALPRVISSEVSAHPESGLPHSFVTWQDYAHDKPEYVSWVSGLLGNGEYGEAVKFKGALDFLSAAARADYDLKAASEFAQFQAQAKTWRDATTKPAMPEEAREHQVLAEYAYKEQNIEKAMNEYAAALAIFPCWPDGQYNLATMAGEKKLYGTAVLHMKEYLELVPQSQDTQAAKDSIIIWRDKLQSLRDLAAKNNAVENNRQTGGSFFTQTRATAK